jgi:hypothetical protein
MEAALLSSDQAVWVTVLDTTRAFGVPVAPLVRSVVHRRLAARPPQVPEALLALEWLRAWPGATQADRASATELSRLIEAGSLAPGTMGLVVGFVAEESQAAAVGLPIGALVLRYAGETVAAPDDLAKAVAACSAAATCTSPELVWWSGGAEHRSTLKPGPIGVYTEPLWSNVVSP